MTLQPITHHLPSANRRPALTRRPVFWLYILAICFTALAFLQLGLVDRQFGATHLGPPLVLAGSVGLVIWLLHARQRWAGDPILLPTVYFLCGFGLALIARLAPAFIWRQTFWLGLATLLLLLINLIPNNLDWLRRYKYSWLISGLMLLASTLVLGVNPSGFGARLWLQVGGIFFQPSELLKLLMIVFLAAYLADRRLQWLEIDAKIGRLAVPHPSYFGPMVLMWGFSMVLLIWQRDLGAALLFFGTFVGMLYAVTGQSRYVWTGALLLLLAGITGYYLFDVVRLRVDGFLNPWLDPPGRSFQIVQSLLAFASGGLFGEGLGQGLPTAIPVVHTDFVYAAIGEEYGLLGALGGLACFALLVSRAIHIGLYARDDFEHLLAVGIGTMLGLQTLVITAGTLKLLPLTGVTLPFVSYGGSSLLVSFVMVGLLEFIARRTARQPDPGPPRARFYAARFTLKLTRLLFYGFAVVAAGLVLWQVAAPPILEPREDNPRPIIEAQRIDRGRLLTRDGVPIAETVLDADGLARRHYPYPGLSSVTGYYSIRYGVGGTEAAFDPILRGTADQTPADAAVDDLLNRPLVGQDVTLTIDLPAQVAADVALGAQEGAVVVMEIDTGAILVMSSHPTYDPNTLDEQWDALRDDARAPLLNRAAQGLFPVGDLARLIGLIGLHEAGATIAPEPLAAPLDTLLGPLGPTGYNATAGQLGLTGALTNIPSLPGRLPDFEGRGTVRDLAVTPLHLLRVVAALERGGQLPQPVLSMRSEGGSQPGFDDNTARAVRSALRPVDETLIGWAGQATPEETGRQSLSWFVGLAPTTALPPVETVPSAALTDEGMIFDPAQIPTAAPTPTPPVDAAPGARYAVVAVVVTDSPDDAPAVRIARAPIQSLLKSPTE